MRSPGNLQGDIVGLLDSTGALVVEYKYDAWGKPLSVTVHESGDAVAKLAKRNPFRYRGYVYDEETGLYYLRSRYYNPEVGRFLNADTVLAQFKAVLSANAFCYCKDNPVMRVDTHGRRSEWLFALKHPFIASHIGKYIEGKRCTNITTTAVRFAVSLKLRQPKSAKGEGTQVNAVRHALWTGIISRFYGSAIAREAVRSHEKKDMLNLGDSLMGKSVTEISEMAFSSHEEADSMCDILNNEIALQMAWNKETPNEICAAVLEEYHNNGLWLINENSTGFRIYKERLSDSSYNAAVNQLAGLDDYGFTIE